MTRDKEPFLPRWSRRKFDSAKETAASKPAGTATPAAAAPAAAPPATKPELPSVDSLRGLASEYKDFLRPGVDKKLRQSALKKLFHDPHFNVMDGLDTYIDDYSKPNPIPEAMLRTLKHAKGLLFSDEKEEEATLPASAKPAEIADSGKPAGAPAEPGAPVPAPKSEAKS
jgi:hypothetical protein